MSTRQSTQGEQSEELFPDTPQGNARRWFMELKASEEELKDWHKEGDTVIEAFRDVDNTSQTKRTRKLNLFTSNTQIERAMLYGNTPTVGVHRRFADADDDVARVAGEMLERVLNEDIQKKTDTYSAAIGQALEDRRMAGLGVARVAYEAGETETEDGAEALVDDEGNEIAPAVEPIERRPNESVETRWAYWKDVLWGPSRVWGEMRWVGFKNLMTRRAIRKRFKTSLGKLVDSVPLNAKKGRPKELGNDSERASPWDRAEVWEIWSKEDKKVYWVVKGFQQTLDEQEDPLELEGFWPCPPFMLANTTTSSMVPKSDYALHRDLFLELNDLQQRISELVDALRVAGVYDGTAAEVSTLMTSRARNKLIPVAKFAMFKEKGGMAGAIDWFPVEQVVKALLQLRDYRREHIDLIQQIVGTNDMMRGQATQAGATLGEQQMKTAFGSVRIQCAQDEFARFASELQQLKAEIISKHFDPQTIIDRSNIMRTPDAQFAQQAVELIQSEALNYRVEVKPEAISLTDFAALKQERLEVAEGIANYMQNIGTALQTMPGAQVPALKILQWVVSGLRGASTIEGVIDQAVTKAEQAAQQAAMNPQAAAPPDPKVQAQQLKIQGDAQKAQSDMQKEQFKLQAGMQIEAAKAQADDSREKSQMEWNTKEAMARQTIEDSSPLNQAKIAALNRPKPAPRGGA